MSAGTPEQGPQCGDPGVGAPEWGPWHLETPKLGTPETGDPGTRSSQTPLNLSPGGLRVPSPCILSPGGHHVLQPWGGSRLPPPGVSMSQSRGSPLPRVPTHQSRVRLRHRLLFLLLFLLGPPAQRHLPQLRGPGSRAWGARGGQDLQNPPAPAPGSAPRWWGAVSSVPPASGTRHVAGAHLWSRRGVWVPPQPPNPPRAGGRGPAAAAAVAGGAAGERGQGRAETPISAQNTPRGSQSPHTAARAPQHSRTPPYWHSEPPHVKLPPHGAAGQGSLSPGHPPAPKGVAEGGTWATPAAVPHP